jgi:hypothetical protein
MPLTLSYLTYRNGGNRELREDLMYRGGNDEEEAMEDDDAVLH